MRLLIERNGLNVLLIGGPDDRPRADEIMQNALQPGRVASIAGQVRLADLPGTIWCTACSL